MTTRRAVDWRSALTLAVLVGILAGCALSAKQRAAVGQFGDSATTFGDVTSSELKAMRDDTIKMTTAVQEVGGLWVEWKRKQALTTIVKATRGAVDQLCDLLARDFDPRTGWVAQQLLVIEAPLVGQASDALAGARTYNDRKTVMDAFRLAQSSRMRRTEVVARVSEAAKAMKKANDALAQAVEDSAWSTQDIQSFAERARSLQTAVTTIVTD